MFESFLAGPPAAIHSLQRIADFDSICFVILKHPLAARWKIVGSGYGLRIEMAEGRRVTQVIKKQFALLGNLIKGNGFDPQTGLFRRAVTGSFSSAQFWICSLAEHSTRGVRRVLGVRIRTNVNSC